MCVGRPLKVVITNYPEGSTERFDLMAFPQKPGDDSSRAVPFGRELYIEREDFQPEPEPGFRRLAPGREVRLRGAYLVTCTDFIEGESGEVKEVRCTFDPSTRGGDAPDGRKVTGTLHWVSAEHGSPVRLRLYDRLFAVEDPSSGPEGSDFRMHLNENSLTELAGAIIEPSALAEGAPQRLQFERLGYFAMDLDLSVPGAPVFNRVIGLKDSWAKAGKTIVAGKVKTGKKPAASKKKRGASDKAAGGGRELPFLHPSEQLRMDSLMDELGLSASDARTLATDQTLDMYFEVAKIEHPNPAGIARLLANELELS